MATIRKRQRRYQVQVRRNGFPTASRTFSSRQSAEKWAAEIELEILSGNVPRPRSRITFSEALSLYLCHKCDSRTKSLGKRCREDLGAYYLDNLTPKVLSDWRDSMLAKGKANQTVRHHLGLVSVVFGHAIRRLHVYAGPNPVQQVEKPSVAHTGRTRVLSPAEVNSLIEGLSKPLRAYILLAYETGMRRGEIERIERPHLDIQNRTLLIPITKTGKPRCIPLSEPAIGWVLDLLAETDRATLNGDYVHRIFSQRANQLGLRDVRFHDLRHSAVTRLFERGLGHFEVAAISGHTTMQMLSRYTHISVTHLHQKLHGWNPAGTRNSF